MNGVTDITEQEIRQACGRFAFADGQAYYKERKVKSLAYSADDKRFYATVQGTRLYEVEVDFEDVDESIKAVCTCKDYDVDNLYCKHIAAVCIGLLHSDLTPLITAAPSAQAVSVRDKHLSASVLSIFKRNAGISSDSSYFAKPVRSEKQELDVEFICKISSNLAYQGMIRLELKVGLKRLYVLSRIKEFLSAVEDNRPFDFSKHFSYDPALHAFRGSDWAVLEVLIEAMNHEAEYREALGNPGNAGSLLRNDRYLPILPHMWEKLVPFLKEPAKVTFEHGLASLPRLEILQGEPPLRMELSKPASTYYQLDFHNLDRIEVLERYGYAIAEGKLHKLKPHQLRRLTELKESMRYAASHQVRIESDELDPVMNGMIRGLKSVGSLTLAKQITERIVDVPLRGKLYLDRLSDILIAGLEYVYGDISINPLEPEPEMTVSTNRILMRDADGERRLMDLMEQAGFQRDEGRLWLEEEDAVYEFLYQTLPVLEKLVDVYATSEFKPYITKPVVSPKISVEWDEKTHWLEVKFDMAGAEDTDIRQILSKVVEKRKYVRLKDGSFLSLQSEEFRELERVLQRLNVRKTELKGAQLRLSVTRGFPLLADTDPSRNLKLGKSFRQLLNNLRNPDHMEFPIPGELTNTLRDYQKFGFQWMRMLAHYRFGGILADDMGLGKTLQSITYIVSELGTIRSGGAPVLIVCPASLIYNWHNEIVKFAPMLRAEVIAGAKKERTELLNALSERDVLITSYPLLRRDMDLYEGIVFHTFILDEAQMIKNHNTQTAQSVKDIQAHQRFALTGTPVENSLEELWSIFDAVFPELFDSRRAFQDLLRDDVAKRVRPFILRRMKADVLKELPDKIETLQTSELTPEQKQLYVTYLAKLKKDTAKQLSQEGFQKARMRILAGLTRLRQLCCHPSLFVDNYKGESGKMQQLMELVEEALGSGKRILLFSQFTGMLAIIRQALELRGESCFYLDGSTPSKERVELCRRFNEGEQDLFLISLKAGGTGLNLTGADTVILYDLWWNPAVEQQATDRAHRIGQTNVVQVIRLLAQGTVEEKMYDLQQKKKDLLDQVIQPGEEAFSSMSEADLREILNL